MFIMMFINGEEMLSTFLWEIEFKDNLLIYN